MFDDKQNLHRDLLHTLVMKAGTAFLTLIFSIFMTRILGVEGRGVYAKLQASLSLFLLILGFGLNSSIVYFYGNEKIRRSQVLGISLCILGASSFILGVVGFVGCRLPALSAVVLARDHGDLFFQAYLVLSFVFSFVFMILNGFLRADHDFRRANWLEAFSIGLRTLIVAAAFSLGSLSAALPLKAVLALDLFVTAVSAFVGLAGAMPRIRLVPDFRLSLRDVFLPFVRFSTLVYFSSLIGFLYYRIDIWIVERMRGVADLGIYSLAVNVAQMLTLVPMTLNSVLYPHLVKNQADPEIDKLCLVSRLNASAVLVLAVLVGATVDHWLPRLYGREFDSALLPIKVLLPGVFFVCFKFLFSTYNVARGRTWLNLMIESAALVLNVILNCWFVPRYGILGAAVISSVTQAFACALTYHSVVRVIPRRKQAVLLTPSDVREFWGQLRPVV